MTSPEKHASVYESGSNQVVQIPAEFRLNVDRVSIKKVGENLVIIPSTLSALDALDLVTHDLPDDWAEGLERPEDHSPTPIGRWAE